LLPIINCGWFRWKQRFHMEPFEKLWLDGTEAIRLGDFQSAADKFQHILQGYRCDAEAVEVAHRMRGICFQLQGDYPRALAEFERSLDARPQSPLARCRLAYLLAMAPDDALRDGRRARALASAAASQPHELQWVAVTILAAAEAETGDFDNAVATYERAMQMMPEAQRERRQDRLEQLRAGHPIRCSVEYDRVNMFEFNRHAATT
jgi:tetratricopeptide (TPR) repeat protein